MQIEKLTGRRETVLVNLTNYRRLEYKRTTIFYSTSGKSAKIKYITDKSNHLLEIKNTKLTNVTHSTGN